MTKASRSQIAHLLELQQYEDALPVLGDLMNRNPSDREARICHLLVVRILILRWTLSRVDSKQATDSRSGTKGVIGRLVSLASACEFSRFIRSGSRVCQATERVLSLGVMKPLASAGAVVALLVALLMLPMYESGDVSVPELSKTMVPAAPLHPTISGLDAKTYDLYQPRTVDEEDPAIPGLMALGEGHVLRVAYQTRELLPGERLERSTEDNQPRSGSQLAKTITRLDVSDAVAGRPTPAMMVKTIDARDSAAADSHRTVAARKILGVYQSERRLSIRERPRFAAPSVREIDRGQSLNVLEFAGSWAKVEFSPAGIIGFVRREFLSPDTESDLDFARAALP